MSEYTQPTTGEPLSDTMIAWLKLRRELEERITDPETLTLFQEFMRVDLVLFEEESREAFERGAVIKHA